MCHSRIIGWPFLILTLLGVVKNYSSAKIKRILFRLTLRVSEVRSIWVETFVKSRNQILVVVRCKFGFLGFIFIKIIRVNIFSHII
jgi:hypothetical protein